MKATKIIFFSLAVMLLTACNNTIWGVDKIVGTGPLVTETRMLKSFDDVQLQVGADINIIESDSSYVRVSIHENLLDYLETKVVKNTLYIDFGGNSVLTSLPTVIDIYTPDIQKFTLAGAGRIKSDLALEEINISGAGSLYCKGNGTNVNISITGQCDMDLYDMPVENATIRIAGSGNVKLHADRNINATISGVGYVYYKGSPTIEKNISGIGNVIDKN